MSVWWIAPLSLSITVLVLEASFSSSPTSLGVTAGMISGGWIVGLTVRFWP